MLLETQTYTMYIYKRDGRYKTGERLVSVTLWPDRTPESMQREVRELTCELYSGPEWRFEFVPHFV